MDPFGGQIGASLELIEHRNFVVAREVLPEVRDLLWKLLLDLEPVEDGVAVWIDCDEERCVTKIQDTIRDLPPNCPLGDALAPLRHLLSHSTC
jgi:hypothetical protein